MIHIFFYFPDDVILSQTFNSYHIHVYFSLSQTRSFAIVFAQKPYI